MPLTREDKGDREGIPHTHPTPYGTTVAKNKTQK